MFDLMLRNPFEELWALASPFGAPRTRATFAPASSDLMRSTDVVADENGWKVRVALPGVAPEHVAVNVAGQTLHVRAIQEAGDTSVRYERRLNIPETVDAERVSATYRHGLLEVALPLRESAKPRQVSIVSQLPTPNLQSLVVRCCGPGKGWELRVGGCLEVGDWELGVRVYSRPGCLYRSMSWSWRVGASVSWPRTKTCSTRVVNSNGSPLQTTTLAALPAASEPMVSATPNASAGASVTARSASSHGRP
jgi:HSP20 family protein